MAITQRIIDKITEKTAGDKDMQEFLLPVLEAVEQDKQPHSIVKKAITKKFGKV